MARYSITALKDITVSARIVFRTLRPFTGANAAHPTGSAPVVTYRPETFKLPKGASRDDVASLIGVTDGPLQPARETAPVPDPGATARIRDLLLLERVE